MRRLDDGVSRRHDRYGDDERLVSLEGLDQGRLIVEINSPVKRDNRPPEAYLCFRGG
jgi:hypothetical protein